MFGLFANSLSHIFASPLQKTLWDVLSWNNLRLWTKPRQQASTGGHTPGGRGIKSKDLHSAASNIDITILLQTLFPIFSSNV